MIFEDRVGPKAETGIAADNVMSRNSSYIGKTAC